MIEKTINEQLKKILDEIIKKDFPKLKKVDYLIEKSKTTSLGDYSTNIALVSSKVTKSNPLEFAEKFVKKIKNPLIKKVEAVKPGFINIFLSDKFYDEMLTEVTKEKENYGQFKNKKVSYHIEYVSANPTGSLHIGHARNAAFGSTLSNIWEKYGFDVDREYYINDGGNQINKLGLSVLIRYLNLFNKKVQLPKDAYHGEEPIWVAKYLKKVYGDKFINTKYNDDKILDKEDRETINTFSKTFLMDLIKVSLQNFKAKFDIYYPESNIYKLELIKPTLMKMKKDLYVSEGALWLKTTKYGDDKDRVLIKSDGTLTYFTPDIAYHDIKIHRKKYTKALDILGADHASYQDRLKASIHSLGRKDVLEVVIMQMVKLVKDGKEFKMSKRTGNALTLNDLMETIGVDCARWYLISQSINSHLEIDVDKVTSTDNNNSFYYVQYAHARITQVLLQAKVDVDKIKPNTKLLTSDKERELLSLISNYPKLIENISLNYEVHKLTAYLLSLSQVFHSYYGETKLINDKEPELMKQRLLLINSVKNIIASGLKLIAIEPKDKI